MVLSVALACCMLLKFLAGSGLRGKRMAFLTVTFEPSPYSDIKTDIKMLVHHYLQCSKAEP